MARNALLISVALLVAAVVVRGFLGAGLAAAGAIPAAYAAWQGTQEQGQGKMAKAMTCMVASLVIAVALVVVRVLHWL
jgi:hypothetical protein